MIILLWAWVFLTQNCCYGLIQFSVEPPDRLEFANTVGATLDCAAETSEPLGNDNITINWIYKDGSSVTTVPGLRHVDGSRLKFLSFRADNYRMDVHSAIYICVATCNGVGKLVSRDVQVNGVVIQQQDTQVYDTYVIQHNTAVLRCHIPTMLNRYVSVVDWIRNENQFIKSTITNTSNDQYAIMPNGDLHIYNVKMEESGTKYRCKAQNSLTGVMQLSTGNGQLYITESRGPVPPKMLETSVYLQAEVGKLSVIPCVAQGNPVPTVKWFKKNSYEQMLPVTTSSRITITKSSLKIRKVQLSDEGIYTCSIDNANNVQITANLTVFEKMSVKVIPKIVLAQINNNAKLTCEVTGHPIKSIMWYHNGEIIRNANDNIFIIEHVKPSNKGFYQCMISNGDEMIQSSAELQLTETVPQFTETFKELNAKPKTSISLRCQATGTPLPTIYWTIDRNTISNNRRISFSSKVENGQISSILNVDSVETEDGGLYSCVANSKGGKYEHSARLNVYGPIGIRKVPQQLAVSDGKFDLNCPFYGFPYEEIKWHKDGSDLPYHWRQNLYENGTLEIANVDKVNDAGEYKCAVSASNGKTVEGIVNVKVLVSPKIVPFEFQDELLREGMRARLQCVISEGDSPLTVTWLKDGSSITPDMAISVKALDEFSSILTINHINPKHNGKYTCVASNEVATVTHVAHLSVNVAPKVIPFSFLDDQFYKGMRAHVTCAISQGDLPVIFQWLKDGEAILPSALGISTRKYDENTDSLSIENVESRHSGNYTCIASNVAGTAMHTAQLMVRVHPKIVPFQFGNFPYEGSSARVVCGLQEGDAPVHFSWLYNGESIYNDNSNMIITKVSDGQSSILSISKLSFVKHTGMYTCIAENEAGADRYEANLHVKVPPKIVPFEFKEEQLAEGQLARVSCIVSRGDLPLIITWEKDGVILTNEEAGAGGIQVRSFDEHSSILSISSIKSKHNGQYVCIAKNAAGMARHSTHVLVKVPPRWIKIPSDISVLKNEPVMMHCAAEGFPQPTITWQHNANSKSLVSAKPVVNDNNLRIYPNGSLFIAKMDIIYEGAYYCYASNGIGNGLGRKIQLKVNVAPPSFNEMLNKINVNAEANAELHCSVHGDTPIQISWFRENKFIQESNARYKIQTQNSAFDGHSVLTVLKTTRGDNGNYTCTAENIYGNNQTIIELAILESPDPPSQLKAKSIGSHTAELTWTSSYNGNDPIKKYNIQYKNVSEKWDQAVTMETVNGIPTNSIVTQLTPFTSYHFRIFAENTIGKSLASQILRITTEEDVPTGMPMEVHVESVNTETFRVYWKAPKESDWNGRLLGYHIGYKEVDTIDPYIIKTLVTTEPSDNNIFVHIGGLKQFTKYAVIVQCYNSRGKGPATEPVVAMTSEGSPRVAPTDIRCTTLTSQSIHVTWTGLNSHDMNGILRGYKILYRLASDWLGGSDDTANHFNTTLSTSTTLDNLDKFSNYSIQVLAMTKAGNGPKSQPVYCKTLDDVPNAPSDIKVVTSSEYSVFVAWTKPDNPNGILIAYTLYWKMTGSKQDPASKTVSADTNQCELDGLVKGQRYDFWVTATTIAGEGQGSKIITQMPNGPNVPARITSFDNKITATWKSAITLQCAVIAKPESSQRWTFKNQMIDYSDRIYVNNDGSLVISEVSESDAGDFVCHAQNDLGKDKITYTIIVIGPPPSPVPEITSITSNSIEVQWTIQTSKTNRIQGYTLHLRKDGSDWSELSIGADSRNYRVTSLECGTRYELYMTSHNRIGIYASSTIKHFSTNGSVPIAPTDTDLIESRTDSIALFLNSWKSHECNIQYYIVEYAPKSSNQWTTAASNIKPEQRRLVIPNLKPGSWYSLRMTAHNSAGSTIAKYDFATLTNTGATISPDLQSDDAPQETINGLMATLNFYVIVPISCTVVILFAIFAFACLWLKMKNRDLQNLNANRLSVVGSEIRRGASSESFSYTQRELANRQILEGHYGPEEIAPYATLQLPGKFQATLHRQGNVINSGERPNMMFNHQFVIPQGIVGFAPTPDGHMETTFVFPPPPPEVIGDSEIQENRIGYQNDITKFQ